MKNYLAAVLRFPTTACSYSCSLQRFLFLKQQKVLKILKPDGSFLEFKAAVVVNDVLINFPSSGIVASEESTEELPLHQELRIGKVYYLVPGNKPKSEERKAEEEGSGEEERSKRRIKVVITKQQLQDLLSNKVSMEEVLLSALNNNKGDDINRRCRSLGSSSSSSSSRGCCVSNSNWKPQLESIPE